MNMMNISPPQTQKAAEIAIVQRKVHGAFRALWRMAGLPKLEKLTTWPIVTHKNDATAYSVGEDSHHDKRAADYEPEAPLRSGYQTEPWEVSAFDDLLLPMQWDLKRPDQFEIAEANIEAWKRARRAGRFDVPWVTDKITWDIIDSRAWQEWYAEQEWTNRLFRPPSPWTWARIAKRASLSERQVQQIHKGKIEVALKRHLVLLGRPRIADAA